MKIYVAAKFEEASRARQVMDRLEAAGHQITYDWTAILSSTAEQARADFLGAAGCDLLLLLNHPNGKGMYVEMGVALALQIPVIVVEPTKSNNIFFKMCATVPTIEEGLSLIDEIKFISDEDFCRIFQTNDVEA